jgi:hypothetical protein
MTTRHKNQGRRWPGKTPAREALNCIGAFLFRAMYVDGNLDFTVSTRVQADGSSVISVLHPDGTFEFVVPEVERRAEATRQRSLGID